ncbi:MAG: hypothetical protein ACYC35_20010 [Pirellulales bacterium]
MKKVACFLLVLTLGVFAMGCGGEKKKTETKPAADATAPADATKPADAK